VRFTFGTYKFAVRTPGFTIASSGDAPRFPTTSRSIQKAAREYHVAGAAAARQSLRDSLSGSYWRQGRGATMAHVARGLLEDYFAMDALNPRPAATFDLKSDVGVGPDVVEASIDICLFETTGYGARVVLWDTRGCDDRQARLLLAPCVVALEQEFGAGAAESAEVWDMRTTTMFAVTPQAAIAALSAVGAILHRVQQ
jgi:hypothetical protein